MQEDVRGLLGGAAVVTDLVDQRIFPGEIPDDEPQRPWLYYAVPESVPIALLDGTAGVRHSIEFHAFADSYSQAAAIVAAILDVLNGLTWGRRVNSSFWSGTGEEVTEDGYHHVARFDIEAKFPSGLVVGNGTFPSCYGSFLIAPKGF
jgi:hypothetical protein